MIPHKQLSLADIFSDSQEKFENDKYQFLSLLENTINLSKFIPISFRNHFYASTGRPREYPLIAMLWALLLQRIFSIPTDSLLIIFLKYSKELRDFCGFDKVPDASKFTRFKQDFILDLYLCSIILLILLNRYANKLIKLKLHFCYVYKFGMVTNGLCIVRNISFFNKDFLNAHPDIIIDKKSDSPDEDKSLHDAKAVIPVLKDFFEKHPLIKPDIFIGDAAFDSAVIYKSLLQDIKFSKAYIPLNSRSKLKNEECPINDDGIPCCPHDHSLPMKPEGISKRKNGLVRFKFSCPKVKFVKQEKKKYKRQCYCGKSLYQFFLRQDDLYLSRK